MRALAKVSTNDFRCLFFLVLIKVFHQLVSVNNPDKIIFVGEALVANEAVDQLTKFDRALRDFSSASGAGKGRGIDGMACHKVGHCRRQGMANHFLWAAADHLMNSVYRLALLFR